MSDDVNKSNKDICCDIIDIIYDKVDELIKKDVNISGFKKAIILRGAVNMKGSTKEYITSMNDDEALDIISRVKKSLE